MGMQPPLCLILGESEPQSILELPCPTPTPIHTQLLIPYVLGVERRAGEDLANEQLEFEEHHWQSSFRIALAALVGDLARVLLGDIRSPAELSVGVRDNICLSMAGRYGIFTIGVSQTD